MSEEAKPLRFGIAGLGTVGTGLIHILTQYQETYAQRCGRPVVVSAISARNKKRERGIDLTPYRWESDPVALATPAMSTS